MNGHVENKVEPKLSPKAVEGIDPKDPSVVYDKPFRTVSGRFNYNGKAYDRASLWIDPKTKLVLPDAHTEVIRNDDANAVVISMEKRMTHYSHGGDDYWPISKHRSRLGCAVKLEKGNLMIGTFGEYSYLEGSESLRLVIQVPANVEVIRRAGLIGGMGGRAGSERPPELINPARGEPKPALTKTKESRPEFWLPPQVEDGWHEIPAVADRERGQKP